MDTPLEIRVFPDGSTEVGFFAVEYSEFIIDYVLNKKDREMYAAAGARKIYCG